MNRTRAQRFDDLVLDAVSDLERRWARQLAAVEFAVEDVPPVDAWTRPEDPIPLSRFVERAQGQPARIVVYRRPLETRAVDSDDLGALVHDVIVDEVATMLGVEPEVIDPEYGEG